MNVVKMIYMEYVEKKHIMDNIPLYWLGQDPLEIFFGRCRSLNGFNDNPTVQQFMGAFRKLLAFDAILCSSFSNFTQDLTPARPSANILHVSSAPESNKADNKTVSTAELETLYQKLSEMEQTEKSSIPDSALDYSIAYTSYIIEQRINSEDRMYCMLCKHVFIENEKITESCSSYNDGIVVCRSTFEICKEANRFIKLELIRSYENFQVIREGIWNHLNAESLFSATDFSHSLYHRDYVIRSIIDIFIHIRATCIAREATLNIHDESVRSKLTKLIHAYGQ